MSVAQTMVPLVLDSQLDDMHDCSWASNSQEAGAWTILNVMPDMYLAIIEFDLRAGTSPCLQLMPIVAILQTKSSLA